MKKISFVVILGIVLALIKSNLFASGFFLYHHDAKAQGQAGAFIAQADSPSAVYYNPAGMSQLDGTQISLGSEFILLQTEYENVAGISEDLEEEWTPVPHIYLTSDFNTEKLTFGLGIYAPFGLGTSWKDTGLLRYVATNTDFNMVNINPGVSYQLSPGLSLAVGVDYYNVYSYISKKKVNMIVGDAEQKLEVDGNGLGVNLGILWKPAKSHSFGLAYRSSVDVDLDGDVVTKNIPAGLGLPTQIKYNVSSEITLPSVISCGYAFRPTDKVKVECDLYWVEWSTVDKVKIKDKSTGTTLSEVTYDWDDTFIFALGGEYYLNDKWTLRGGYSFQQKAVPEKTFTPSLPDSDLHVIALGLGYTREKFSIDIAYSVGLYNKRSIENDVGTSIGTTVDGDYSSTIHYIGITLGYKF